jgi:DNA-directed RNA polymerase specialized sigma24 family protein
MTSSAVAPVDDSSAGRSDAPGRAAAALREHAGLLARVCMALLGDRDAVEGALERVAREAGAAPPAAAGGAGSDDAVRTKTWLLGLARAACAAQISKHPVRTREPEGPSAATGEQPPATARLGSAEQAHVARASLAKLVPTEREAVVLALVGGLDVEHVALACGLELATARARLARGLSKLLGEGTT